MGGEFGSEPSRRSLLLRSHRRLRTGVSFMLDSLRRSVPRQRKRRGRGSDCFLAALRRRLPNRPIGSFSEWLGCSGRAGPPFETQWATPFRLSRFGTSEWTRPVSGSDSPGYSNRQSGRRRTRHRRGTQDSAAALSKHNSCLNRFVPGFQLPENSFEPKDQSDICLPLLRHIRDRRWSTAIKRVTIFCLALSGLRW